MEKMLQGEVALVTGASRGIGAAIASARGMEMIFATDLHGSTRIRLS